MKRFSEIIDESSIHDMTPVEYQQSLIKDCPDARQPQMSGLKKGDIYHNPPTEEKTGDRKAFGSISWIEYWRRLTGCGDVGLRCTFCGQLIFFDVDSCACHSWRMDHPDEMQYMSKDDYQAVGGHFHKNGKDNSDGYIIVPCCKSCNGKADDTDLVVCEENMFVEEVGASK